MNAPTNGLNPNWNDQVEQRLLAKQALDAIAFAHDGKLDTVATASDLDGFFSFCSCCSDQEWRHEVVKTCCPKLAEAIAACEAAGCTHAEIAMVIRRSVE